MSKVAKNWADRPHCPPGDNRAQPQRKALASGFVMPKPERRTRVDLGGSSTGAVHTPGYFRTAK